MSDPAIRAALRDGALAQCDAPRTGHPCRCAQDGAVAPECLMPTAAAVARFLRALPGRAGSGVDAPWLMVAGFGDGRMAVLHHDLAAAVERAAREPAP